MVRKAPRLLALVAVAVWFVARSAAAQPIGAIDTPTEGQTVTGVVKVSGFVLDSNTVDRIEVLVDDVLVNRADTDLPRPDVLEIFPTYFNGPTAQPGFRTSFLARSYSNGPHTVAVRVTESATQQQFIVGTVHVVVDSSINQAPFGYIDTPGPDGLEGALGSFPVTGWALDDVGVDHVDFLVDGLIMAGAVGNGAPSSAIYGTPRPDVQASFPDVPNSLNSGFIANIDTTQLINGLHILSVRATDSEGASQDLGSRTIWVNSIGQNLAPFGAIDFPLDKASLFCSTIGGGIPSPCTPDICGGILTNIVEGWALDVGSALDRGQVSYVELLLDGQIVANSHTSCVQLGQDLINCYGVNRPDVAQRYVGYVNADNAGFDFRFALVRDADDPTGLIDILLPTSDSGTFILGGFTGPGKHTLAIRAGDEEETVSQIAAMSVDILCDQQFGDQPAFGYIDAPSHYEYINGIFEVLGWASDFQGVDHVEVDVDGQVVGTAVYGLARPDVRLHDPRVLSPNVGFSFALDTTRLSDSPHDLVVYVTDRLGNRTEIGRRKFVVDNNVATHQ